MGRKRLYGSDLLRKGGKWLGAARSWLQHKRTTNGTSGDLITWGDSNARFELGADDIEKLASEVAASIYNEQSDKQDQVNRLLSRIRELEIELEGKE